MMKKLIVIMLVAGVLGVMTSCVDEQTSAVDITGTATIRGIVEIDSDVTNATRERAEGVVVRVIYDMRQLSVSVVGQPRWVTLETTTNAQGEYSIDVPCTSNSVDYGVLVDDIITGFTYDDGGSNVTDDALFEGFGIEVDEVFSGETRIVDLDFGGPERLYN